MNLAKNNKDHFPTITDIEKPGNISKYQTQEKSLFQPFEKMFQDFNYLWCSHEILNQYPARNYRNPKSHFLKTDIFSDDFFTAIFRQFEFWKLVPKEDFHTISDVGLQLQQIWRNLHLSNSVFNSYLCQKQIPYLTAKHILISFYSTQICRQTLENG